MEYYAARNKSTATQNMEELHPCDVEQKKNPERKLYILTNSIYTKFIKKAKLTHDIRIGGRVVNFGKQERGSG